MKIHNCAILATVLLGLFTPSITTASSFEDASKNLDLDGSFIGYIDFEGDSQKIATHLTAIYQDLAEVNPQVPPIPLDFNLISDTLGFSSIKGAGMSSKEIKEGLFHNRSITLFDGSPQGLIALNGTQSIEFTAAKLAPADATTVVSGQANMEKLKEVATSLASQIMGPMGEAMITQQLAAPLMGSPLTGDNLLQLLSGNIDLIMKQSIDPVAQEIDIWVKLSEAAQVIDVLKQMGPMISAVYTESETGTIADLSQMMKGKPFGLFLETQGDDLLIYTSKNWAENINGSGEKISDTPDFKALTSYLPEKAISYSYSSGTDITPILETLKQNPESAAYMPLIEKSVDLFLSGLLSPNASAAYLVDNGIAQSTYAGFSYKQALLAVPVGISAAMAIPAAQQVKGKAIENEVRNNLTSITTVAQQIMLDKGTTKVTYREVIESNLISEITPVAGESYEDIIVDSEVNIISVTLSDGKTISHSF